MPRRIDTISRSIAVLHLFVPLSLCFMCCFFETLVQQENPQTTITRFPPHPLLFGGGGKLKDLHSCVFVWGGQPQKVLTLIPMFSCLGGFSITASYTGVSPKQGEADKALQHRDLFLLGASLWVPHCFTVLFSLPGSGHFPIRV